MDLVLSVKGMLESIYFCCVLFMFFLQDQNPIGQESLPSAGYGILGSTKWFQGLVSFTELLQVIFEHLFIKETHNLFFGGNSHIVFWTLCFAEFNGTLQQFTRKKGISQEI